MKKLTTQDVLDIIESEGLEYSVKHKLGAENIADDVLAELWQNAADALNAIEEYLATETYDEDDFEDDEDEDYD